MSTHRSTDSQGRLIDLERNIVEKVRGVWSGFKGFLGRDNVLEVAVGLIMAGGFSTVVNSMVNDILLPPISLLPFMGRNLPAKFAVLRHGRTANAHYNTLQQAADDGVCGDACMGKLRVPACYIHHSWNRSLRCSLGVFTRHQRQYPQKRCQVHVLPQGCFAIGEALRVLHKLARRARGEGSNPGSFFFADLVSTSSCALVFCYPPLLYLTLGHYHERQTSVFELQPIPGLSFFCFGCRTHIAQVHLLSDLEQSLAMRRGVDDQLPIRVLSLQVPFWRRCLGRKHCGDVHRERRILHKLWYHVRGRVLRIEEEDRDNERRFRRVFPVKVRRVWILGAILWWNED